MIEKPKLTGVNENFETIFNCWGGEYESCKGLSAITVSAYFNGDRIV